MTSPNLPFTLGVTGGIGSGKTAVCRVLESLGVPVFYADAEAKRLMAEDPEARAEIEAALGVESYTADGRLNRAYLSAQVFADADKLAQLNAIVHPRVYAAFARARAEAGQAGRPVLAKEAALIFETGGDQHLDAVLVVEAPMAVRIARVVARDGVTPEQVQARMQHQWPAEALRARADYVLENAGTPEALRADTEALYHRIVQTLGLPAAPGEQENIDKPKEIGNL